MEYLNDSHDLGARPVEVTIRMGDWQPDDIKLRNLLNELPYPAFRLFIPKYLRAALEDIIKRSINSVVKYEVQEYKPTEQDKRAYEVRNLKLDQKDFEIPKRE